MPFRVVCAEKVTSEFLELLQQATQVGDRDQVLKAAKMIVERLQTDPLTFGEPSQFLQSAQVIVRRCAISPLVVHYAVSEDKQVVFVLKFQLLPGQINSE